MRSSIASCIVLATVALALAACASPYGTTMTRAANDFQCPEDKVILKSLGGTSYRAWGCGKTAVYNCTASDASKGTVTAYACIPEQPPVATQPAMTQ
jgi:hypothetical protein